MMLLSMLIAGAVGVLTQAVATYVRIRRGESRRDAIRTAVGAWVLSLPLMWFMLVALTAFRVIP